MSTRRSLGRPEVVPGQENDANPPKRMRKSLMGGGAAAAADGRRKSVSFGKVKGVYAKDQSYICYSSGSKWPLLVAVSTKQATRGKQTHQAIIKQIFAKTVAQKGLTKDSLL